MMIGLIIIGGNNFINYVVLFNLIRILMMMYIILFMNNVISMFFKLCVFNFVIIGVINVKLDLKYVGICVFVIKI